MHSGCVRHTELPGVSRLFADFVYHRDRVAAYYEHDYQRPESYAEAVRAMEYPEQRRRALVAALRRQNGDSPQLELLARPGTVAVVTGQQVGLFSGPCYTIYKALTAARLTADLNARGIPAVTVFWLATEDHDFEEVNHCWVFNGRHEISQLRVDSGQADHRPAGLVEIPRFGVERLGAALDGLPFAEEVTELAAASYADGRTMGAAFADLLRGVLRDVPMLYLDPMDPEVRAIAAPLVREAIAAAPRLSERLLERNRELEASGYHAQVHFEEKTSLFFLLEGGRRLALKRSGEEYQSEAGVLPARELAARADHISPNALLRPVVQDYLLPAVAQIGGPAEVAYLAQSQVIYRELGRPTPVVTPRTGFTILDVRAEKLMDRYGLQIRDFFDGQEALLDRVSRKLVPETLRDSLSAVHSQAEGLLDRLHADLAGFDPTLAASLNKSRSKIRYQFSKIEAKTARAVIRRNQRAGEDAAYLYNLLFPNKHLQERVYTFLPFLARHGLGLTAKLEEMVRLDCHDHHVVTV